MAYTNVKVDLKKLEQFKKVVDDDLRLKGNGPVRKALKQWGFRYRVFLKDRYITFSRGGGNWEPLKQSTINRRRKKSSSILVDTGTLIGAFEPEFQAKPGQLNDDIPFGVRVGAGGKGQPHPEAKGITIHELFEIHHFGRGNVPAREIIVPPSEATIQGMRGDMQRAIKKLTDG